MGEQEDLPIVLLHGCGGSPGAAFERSGWLDAISAVGRRGLAVTLPGHGSGQPREPQDYSDMAGALLERLPPGRFDAVGFSLGGKLLLDLLLRVPDRIRRVVLGGVGDNVFAPEAVGEAAALALENGPTAQTPAPVLAFLQYWEPTYNDPAAVAAVLRRPPNPIFTDSALGRIRHPVLIVNGSDDPIEAIGGRLFQALSDVSKQTLPAVGHFDLTAQPQFITAALQFLSEEAGAMPEMWRAG